MLLGRRCCLDNGGGGGRPAFQTLIPAKKKKKKNANRRPSSATRHQVSADHRLPSVDCQTPSVRLPTAVCGTPKRHGSLAKSLFRNRQHPHSHSRPLAGPYTPATPLTRWCACVGGSEGEKQTHWQCEEECWEPEETSISFMRVDTGPCARGGGVRALLERRGEGGRGSRGGGEVVQGGEPPPTPLPD